MNESVRLEPPAKRRGAARWMRLLGGAATMAVVVVVGARFAAPRILARVFRVRRAGLELDPGTLGLAAQDVTLAGPNGRRLKAWFVACTGDDRPRPAALVIHGWNGAASLMLAMTPLLHAAGLHALFLDARGHGRSDEDRFASMPRFAEDIEVGVRWLRGDRRVEPGCVVLVGHSVGAGASLLVASRDPRVAAVISIASMANPATLMRASMHARGVPAPVITVVLREIERVIGLRFDTFAPVVTIGRVRAPVLLVHGGRDGVVPPSDAELLERASEGRARLLIVPEAEHASIGEYLTATPAVRDFLARAVRGCR